MCHRLFSRCLLHPLSTVFSCRFLSLNPLFLSVYGTFSLFLLSSSYGFVRPALGVFSPYLTHTHIFLVNMKMVLLHQRRNRVTERLKGSDSSNLPRLHHVDLRPIIVHTGDEIQTELNRHSGHSGSHTGEHAYRQKVICMHWSV